MNLDQLIKLVKLANNNPNDHEANAAARKVCKMIAANNYKFSNTREPEPVKAGGTWNDVKRSTEPEFRSKPFTGGNPFGGRGWEDAFWERYREDIEGRFYRPRQRPYEPPKPPPEPPKRKPENWTWTQGEDGNIKYKKVYEQKLRDCSICDKSRLTADTDSPYVCADCKWRKYDQEKNKT